MGLSSFSVAILSCCLCGTNPRYENKTTHRRKLHNNAFKQRREHLYSDQAITGTSRQFKDRLLEFHKCYVSIFWGKDDIKIKLDKISIHAQYNRSGSRPFWDWGRDVNLYSYIAHTKKCTKVYFLLFYSANKGHQCVSLLSDSLRPPPPLPQRKNLESKETI